MGSLVVTHPFHPLRGHRLDVLQTRRWGASRMYVCDGGLLGSVVLSEETTDRGPEAAERPLTLEVLAGLVVLVADLAGERGWRDDCASMGGGASGRAVPARARELAARLSALFHRDCLIVGRLNDAQLRLREANERLWSGLASDAFGLVYDGAASAGHSQIAGLMADVPGGESRPWFSLRCKSHTGRFIVPFASFGRRRRSGGCSRWRWASCPGS